MVMKKLAAIGDSFSTTKYGRSWPDFVSDHLQSKLTRACSAGAGNAFYVEKCHDIVKDPEVDLVIVQLTEPSRVVIGSQTWQDIQAGDKAHPIPSPADYYDPSHNNIYKDIGSYTMNIHNNCQWLDILTGQDSGDLDKFWLREVAGTRFYDYQTIHNMLAIKALCDQWKKPLVFFSWFVDSTELILPGYEWLKDVVKIVPGSAAAECNRMMLKKTDCGHYATAESQQLVDTWLWPHVQSILEDMRL
jgi:hypothetical protein